MNNNTRTILCRFHLEVSRFLGDGSCPLVDTGVVTLALHKEVVRVFLLLNNSHLKKSLDKVKKQI